MYSIKPIQHPPKSPREGTYSKTHQLLCFFNLILTTAKQKHYNCVGKYAYCHIYNLEIDSLWKHIRYMSFLSKIMVFDYVHPTFPQIYIALNLYLSIHWQSVDRIIEKVCSYSIQT